LSPRLLESAQRFRLDLISFLQIKTENLLCLGQEQHI
jgi:hypothetical protein